MRHGMVWPRTALTAARMAFDLLSCGTAPVMLDCRGLPGVPQRPVLLAELRTLLLDDAAPRTVRDAVWRVLVTKAREDGPQWRLVAVGMALPGLRRVADVFAGNWRGDVGDRDSELLAGFLERLQTIDLDRPRIAGKLIDAAERAVKVAMQRAADHAAESTVQQDEERLAVGVGLPGPMPPPRPWDHPDWVLTRAVVAGVIGEEEWTLIARTRLEGCSVQSVASVLGVAPGLASSWRRRAELQVVAAIRSGELDCVPLSAGRGRGVAARAARTRGADGSRGSVALRPVVGVEVPAGRLLPDRGLRGGRNCRCGWAAVGGEYRAGCLVGHPTDAMGVQGTTAHADTAAARDSRVIATPPPTVPAEEASEAVAG